MDSKIPRIEAKKNHNNFLLIKKEKKRQIIIVILSGIVNQFSNLVVCIEICRRFSG